MYTEVETLPQQVRAWTGRLKVLRSNVFFLHFLAPETVAYVAAFLLKLRWKSDRYQYIAKGNIRIVIHLLKRVI